MRVARISVSVLISLSLLLSSAVTLCIPIAGDVDESAVIDASDVQLVINAALQIAVPGWTDLNYDYTTDAVDVQLMVNAVLGIAVDSDNDGLFDVVESGIGTEPGIADTDEDGVGDGQEMMDGTDPLDSSSGGVVETVVPNVVGMAESAAYSALTAFDLNVGTVTTDYSNTVPAGRLLSQDPEPLSTVLTGTSIDLVVSRGSATGSHVPDPTDIAPAVDGTLTTDMADSVRFLYTGAVPVQTGVDPDTMDAKRIAVLRGMVITSAAVPLPDVQITVLNHPEFGQTLTRSDGMFDMAVNGGGYLTVNYAKDGYLTAQRRVHVTWRDYERLPRVVLVPLDDRVTTIDFSEPVQVARGSEIEDEDGIRRATLLFEEGTSAEMVFPDGSTQPLSSLDVRATEYTVGDTGPEAMPAELPPTSGYTYCVELTADEALAAGATDVTFDKPLYFYVEDFIGFPVGTAVPTGYYDRQSGEWVGCENGRVIEVLGITGDLADLDTDGDGEVDEPAQLADLNVTDIERQKLATLYPVTPQRLWRVPITHFTPYDCNFPYGPPEDAEYPRQRRPEDYDPDENPCRSSGSSVIEVQNQVLGESIPINGTPFSLHYRSSRVPGHEAPFSLKIPLSGSNLPGSLCGIALRIEVAGQSILRTFDPEPNLTYTFTWDGKDAYGRTVMGKRPVAVGIGYTYRLVYYPVQSDLENSWARVGEAGLDVVNGRVTSYTTLWQRWNAHLGGFDARELGLGGWSLDVHHTYDPSSQELYLGDGRLRAATGGVDKIVNIVAGYGYNTGHGNTNDGGPAIDASLDTPMGVAVAPDGGFYIASRSYVRYVDPDGIISTVAGSGSCYSYEDYSGDGGPATDAVLCNIDDVEIAPDGGFYLACYTGSSWDGRICHVGRNGIIRTVAGGGDLEGDLREGARATSAKFHRIYDVCSAADGSLYFAVRFENRVYRVGPAGRVSTVAGTGSQGSYGDGGPAVEAMLKCPEGVDVGPDGGIYIADTHNHLIRRVDTEGIIRTVAGIKGSYGGYGGDGGPATDANLDEPRCVAVGSDGSIYIGDNNNQRIRYVSPDGIISTMAGCDRTSYYTRAGDGVPATSYPVSAVEGIDLSPDECSVYFTSWTYNCIQKVTRVLPEYAVSDTMIASEDGTQLYRFNRTGRHISTLDSVTGEPIYEFYYDAAGLLTSVVDADGNVTNIERSISGEPVAISNAFGRRTTFALNSNDYFSRITNPAGETYEFEYTADGLLTNLTNPNGNEYQYTYTDMGLLQRAADPAGGSKSLTRTRIEDGYECTLTTAMGRTTSYRLEKTAGGGHLIVTYPSGIQKNLIVGTDGSQAITYPDGTEIHEVVGPDPRWGMQAPVTESMSISMPSGLTYERSSQHEVELTDTGELFSIETITMSTDVNGREYVTLFDAGLNQIVRTTPEGRQMVSTLDPLGRRISSEVSGLAPVTLTYDGRGRVATYTQGTGSDARSYSFTYDESGNPQTVSGPLSWNLAFGHDDAGRITELVLPGGRQISYTYDAGGNLTSVVPPGQPAHVFTYTAVGQTGTYDPPDTGITDDRTLCTFNPDRQLTHIDRPDSGGIEFDYDSGGRLTSATFPHGNVSYGYDLSTGKCTTVTASDGVTLSYEYDGSILEGTTWSGVVNGTVGHTYNNDLHRTETLVNSVSTATFQYDQDGLLVQAGDAVLIRDPASGFITGTVQGPVTTSRSYNIFGELADYGAALGEADLYSAHYVRDTLGRITQKTETVDGAETVYAYEYDTAGRLVSVIENGTTAAAYTYDANGNRLSKTGTGGRLDGTYDVQDRLVEYGDVVYTYTEAGELLSKEADGQVTSYDYDVFGNLRSVEMPDGTQIEYVIDGRNRRVGKRVDGVFVQGFLYEDLLRPAAELDGSGGVVSTFVYGSRRNVPDYMEKNGSVYRIISDHLGSVRLVIDVNAQQIVQRIDYDEFGIVLADTNPGFQPFGFAGGLYDHDTLLTRFGSRDYDAYTGRWTTKDPLLFFGGDTNLYGYVLRDPVNRTDSLGLYVDPCDSLPSWDELEDQLEELLDKLDNVDPDKLEELMRETDELFKEIREARQREGDWVDALGGLGDAFLSVPFLGLWNPGPAIRDALGVGGVNPDTDMYGIGYTEGKILSYGVPGPDLFTAASLGTDCLSGS